MRASLGAGRPAASARQRVARLAGTALRWLPFAVVAAVVVATAAHHLPRVLAFQGAMLRYPFATQGSESLIVYEAGRLARGEGIYVANGPDRHAFTSGPYTPSTSSRSPRPGR